MKIPIVNLTLPTRVIEKATEVLKSGQWVDGVNVHQLEESFAKYCGTKYCRGVSNGTAALMTILAALEIGPGDEVIVPSFSFIATANTVRFTGATPVFADIVPGTFNMDPEDVRKKITDKTQAILPVHLFGLCADMKVYKEICEEKGILLVEDACQAHGAAIEGKKAGSFGVAAAFSLYPTKNMFDGGEGGLITTSHEDLYKKIKLFMNHGQIERYKHVALGYNFRMADVNAVIAHYCLEKLDIWNEKRRENAKYYADRLSKIKSLELPSVPDGYIHCFHQYTIKSPVRDKIADGLKKNDIGYGIHYPVPIHKQEYYQKTGYEQISLPVTEKTANEVISLPIHPTLNEVQLDEVVKVVGQSLV